MANFYKQLKGKLVELNDDEWINNNKWYRYGSKNKEPYYSETVPKCNICGSELNIMKKGKSGLILSCTNEECITNKTVYGDNKLKAFLPEEYYLNILNKRKETHHSYFDKEYLVKIKGKSEEEAEEYIEYHKKLISEKNKGKNNDYYLKKHGKTKFEEHIQRLRKKSKLCIEYWLEKGYSLEESKEKIFDLQSKNGKLAHLKGKCVYKNKQDLIKEKGERGAELFYRERSRLCVEYWLKRGYNEESAKEEIRKIQIENNKKVKQHISPKRLSYWLERGYSPEEAKEKISAGQHTFSLEKCIEKYGKDKGYEVWRKRQEKWQKTLHENGKMCVGFSEVSQELFKILETYYKKEERDYIFYGSKNKEFNLYKNKKNYLYDFVDLKKRKIIEFNGDIYHGNPKLFKENECPNPFKKEKTAKELWAFDQMKKEIAESYGFEELIVWEKDYRENKEKIIENCLKFLLC